MLPRSATPPFQPHPYLDIVVNSYKVKIVKLLPPSIGPGAVPVLWKSFCNWISSSIEQNPFRNDCCSTMIVQAHFPAVCVTGELEKGEESLRDTQGNPGRDSKHMAQV